MSGWEFTAKDHFFSLSKEDQKKVQRWLTKYGVDIGRLLAIRLVGAPEGRPFKFYEFETLFHTPGGRHGDLWPDINHDSVLTEKTIRQVFDPFPVEIERANDVGED